MNKQEIDNMMRELPSQRPQETTLQKFWIGVWFAMFMILCAYAPDIRFQTKESTNGNCQENTRQENHKDSTSKEGKEQWRSNKEIRT